VWGKQGFLHRGLDIWPVKPMVSSLVLVEDTSGVVSDIKVSNGCSGVRSKRMGIDRVFTKGISVVLLPWTGAPQNLYYLLCQPNGVFSTIR
jgi:hypothetical protein